LGKSTKQAYPGTAPLAEILGLVRYFITAVYLYLCFGHFSAAALASAPQGGDSFQLPPESSFIMFYRILQQAMRSITISNTIRNQNTG